MVDFMEVGSGNLGYGVYEMDYHIAEGKKGRGVEEEKKRREKKKEAKPPRQTILKISRNLYDPNRTWNEISLSLFQENLPFRTLSTMVIV